MQTKNFQMSKLDLEKEEEPEIKWPTFAGCRESQGIQEKTSISVSLAMPKPLTLWIIINFKKFLKRWDIPEYLTLPEKSVCGSRSSS